MQNLVNDAPIKKNFAFVDSIRCIAMMSIVYEHASLFWGQNYPHFSDTLIQTTMVLIGKFGTIIFFLISGFLMNYKFGEYTAINYIRNRFRSTFGPWLLWVFILLVVGLIHRLVVYLKFGVTDVHTPGEVMLLIGQTLGHIIFYTNYWFILNFLICISIILAFKRYIYSYKLGAFLGLLSLFYSVNVYFHWVPTEHTTAIFGFVFYLWAGIMINKHFDAIMQRINNTPMSIILLVNLVVFSLSCAESVYLIQHGSNDPFNTLKFTNILYSFAVFILMLKIGEMPVVNKLKPRETTYGIYLIHQIVALYGLAMIFSPMGLGDSVIVAMPAICVAGFGILRFIIMYVSSYILARLLAFSKIKWVVGR
jgi:hypothetical protein